MKILLYACIVSVSIVAAVSVAATSDVYGASPKSPRPEVQKNIKQLLETKKCPGCDLQGAILLRADLSGADLHGANLSDAKLNLADLSGANLKDADLHGAAFGGADLAGADLTGADLTNAQLEGAFVNSDVLDGVESSSNAVEEEKDKILEAEVEKEVKKGGEKQENSIREAGKKERIKEDVKKELPNKLEQKTTALPNNSTSKSLSYIKKAKVEQAGQTQPKKIRKENIAFDKRKEKNHIVSVMPDSRKTVPGKELAKPVMPDSVKTVPAKHNSERTGSQATSSKTLVAIAPVSKKTVSQPESGKSYSRPPVKIAQSKKIKPISTALVSSGKATLKTVQANPAEPLPKKEHAEEKDVSIFSKFNIPEQEPKSASGMKKKNVIHTKQQIIDQLLDTKRCIECDLAGMDLAGEKLKKADLERIDFSGCNLRETDFRGANLKGAKFDGADLHDADFRKADLYLASFLNANLTGARFEDALVDMADFSGAVGAKGVHQ